MRFPGRFLLLSFLFIPLLATEGCLNSPIGPGGYGATVGGAQNIGYARQRINAGDIPEPEWIVAEGLYSEHDIATATGDCVDKLCLALGYGYAPAIDSNREALFIHLGMSSSIRPEGFHREHLQLALVIDRSGSMTGGSIEAVKDALRRLVQKLDADDEVMLVEFNSEASARFGPSRLTEKEGLLRAIEGLEAGGGTDIESGLNLGFKGIAALPSRLGTSKRLILFTDAWPNSGATDPESFRGITKRYADEGIGFTAFGVGVDFGQDLVYHISGLRGGNFFYLESSEKIRTIFDKEFDYLVTPIAYDLKLRLPTPSGLRLVAVYGLPTWVPGSSDAELEIPTVFLSSNRGAIILRYESVNGDVPVFEMGDLLATGVLEYQDIDGSRRLKGGEIRNEGGVLSVGKRGYSHSGTRLGVALTNVYLGLRVGCELYKKGEKAKALSTIDRALHEVGIDNAELNSTGLATELALLQKLAENIRAK